MTTLDSAAAYETSLRAVQENKIGEIPILNLAYIGDTVYDLFVRQYLVKSKMGKVMALHRMASGMVNARAQAQAARRVLPLLTEAESAVFRRGKNAKSAVPKNADPKDYALATAIEAVIGYLFCTGQTRRLNELFESIIIKTEDTDA